ncbi:MAG: hypothetical protein AB8I08_30585 [Sandaracinaceae bacterium]
MDNLLVVVQSGATERARLQDAGRMERQLHAAGAPYAVLVYLSDQTSVPDDEDRKAISGLMQQASPDATGMAVVLAGTGFFAAAMRGVGTAISTLSGHPMPFYRTLDDALASLSEALDGDLPDAVDIKALVERRAAFDEA